MTSVERSGFSAERSYVRPSQVRPASDRDSVSRLMLSRRPEHVQTGRDGSGSGVTDEDVRDFVALVVGDSEDDSSVYVQKMLERGTRADQIYIDLLAPTARQLGEKWQEDSCDFVDVAIALGRMQRIVHELSRVFVADRETPDATGSVLLSCIPGERHTLGLFIVAEFFVRDGWSVSVVPPLCEGELLRLVREERFDLVGFSVACDSDLPRLRREIRNIRAHSVNRHVGILVGGRVFNEFPDLVRRVGADATSSDARGATLIARALIPHGFPR